MWEFGAKGNAFTAPKKVKNIDNVAAVFVDDFTAITIKRDRIVWYVVESFDLVTGYDKNNIDFKYPDHVRKRDDFSEYKVRVLKIQNVQK